MILTSCQCIIQICSQGQEPQERWSPRRGNRKYKRSDTDLSNSRQRLNFGGVADSCQEDTLELNENMSDEDINEIRDRLDSIVFHDWQDNHVSARHIQIYFFCTL